MSAILLDPCVAGSSVGDNWSAPQGSYVAGAGRFGGAALRLSGSQTQPTTNFISTPDTTLGVAFSFSLSIGVDVVLFQEVDNTTVQVRLVLKANNILQLQLGDGTVLASSPIVLAPATKYTFQIHSITHPSAGLFELLFNGDADPLMTFTGNTRRSANSSKNRMALSGNFTGNWDFSDIWYLDNTQPGPSGYQGDILIRDAPLIGDSLTAGKNVMTPTPAQPAGSHYLNVNDSNDATYLSSPTVGDVERFRIQLPFPASAPLWIGARARTTTDDAGPRKLAPVVAQGASEAIGADFSVPSSPGWTPWATQQTDPATGVDWTTGGAASAEIGAKITG